MTGIKKETSNEDRKRIIDAYLENKSAKEIALILKLNISTVTNIINLYINTNRIIKNKRGKPPNKKLTEGQENIIKNWVDEDCSISLVRLKQKCLEVFSINISINTIGRVLSNFHYTVKRCYTQPLRRNDETAIQLRLDYAMNFMQILVTHNHEKIFFFDEVGFSVSMRARRGRSVSGSRAVQIVPALRSRNISMLCSMNKNGMVHYSTSPYAYNIEKCLESLTFLINDLRNRNIDNCVIVCDNVSFHKNYQIKNLIEANGHILLFLPPYSPFLNPIENMFSKLKQYVRSRNPLTEENLLELINNGSQAITSEDCDGYFRNMLKYITMCINRQEIID